MKNYEKLESVESGSHNGTFYKLLKENHDQYGFVDKEYENIVTYPEIFINSMYLGTYAYGNSKELVKYMRDFLVFGPKRYISKHNFNQLASLSKVLPGSGSVQILVLISTIQKKSIFGGFISFAGFVLPSLLATLSIALVMRYVKFAYKNLTITTIDGYQLFNKTDQYSLYIISVLAAGVGQGAISLLFQGCIKVFVQEANSYFQTTIIACSAFLYYLFGCSKYCPIILLFVGGIASFLKMDSNFTLDHSDFSMNIEDISFIGWPCYVLHILLYILFYVVYKVFGERGGNLYIVESYYRMGSLLFAGGHMIAPFLLTEYCKDSIIEEAEILHGLAFASLLPGPIANLSGFIGTLMNGIFAGILASFFLFLPGILISLGSIKYIEDIKRKLKLQYFLKGVTSAAIGILCTSIIKFWYDSCFVNPYSYIHLGTLNIIICYLILDMLEIPVPFVLIFGAMFSFFSFLVITNFFDVNSI